MAWQCTSSYPNVIFFFCKLTILPLAVPMSDFCFQSMQRSILIGFFKENIGDVPFNKNSSLKFRRLHVPNGTVQLCTFQLHRPDLSHCMFAHCSCKQDTKEWFWGQQFCEMEMGHFSPTEVKMTRPVKEDQCKQKWSIPFDVPTEMYGILGWMESTLRFPFDLFNTSWTPPWSPVQKRLGGYAPFKR